jgi:hypothetical protein
MADCGASGQPCPQRARRLRAFQTLCAAPPQKSRFGLNSSRAGEVVQWDIRGTLGQLARGR